MSRWSEGVMGDGAVILRNGEPVTIDAVVSQLDDLEAILEDWRDWYRVAFGAGYSADSLAGRSDEILKSE